MRRITKHKRNSYDASLDRFEGKSLQAQRAKTALPG